MSFLSFKVSDKGLSTDYKLLKAIIDVAPPSNVKETRKFLGMASYYRRFIPNFANIASLLHNLTKSGVLFSWTPEYQSAFDTLKKINY